MYIHVAYGFLNIFKRKMKGPIKTHQLKNSKTWQHVAAWKADLFVADSALTDWTRPPQFLILKLLALKG